MTSRTLLFFSLMTACAPAARTAVGSLDESDAYVAVVADDDHFVAYICDSDTIAVWFDGHVEDGAFSEENEQGLIEGVVAPDSITGTFTAVGGEPDAYAAEDVVGEPYGLWRAEEEVDGAEYVAGWVVAPDSSQRGALMQGANIVDRPALNITDGTSNTVVGTLSVSHIVSPRDLAGH